MVEVAAVSGHGGGLVSQGRFQEGDAPTRQEVVYLPTQGHGSYPWEVRSRAFIFPPEDYDEAPMRRELLPEESGPGARRYYVEVRAVPLYAPDTPDPDRAFTSAVVVYFEVAHGALVTPTLGLWREHQVKTFITDLGHFWQHGEPASAEERKMFDRVIRETYLSGVPLAGF